MSSFIQISDQVFPVANSQLSAYISLGEQGWKISWDIEFTAASREINGAEWEPKISTHAFDVDLCRAYSGELDVDLPDSEDEEPAFMIYIFEHSPLLNARLKLSQWRNGVAEIQLIGSVDVYADDQYGGDLPLRIEDTLRLAGVVVDEHHFPKAEERLPMFFDRSLFGPPERASNGGVIFRLACDA